MLAVTSQWTVQRIVYWFLLLLIFFTGIISCGRVNQVPQSANKQLIPQAGKDYIIIGNPESEIIPKAVPQNEVHIIEFFGYGCHACYEIEAMLQTWLREKSNFVKFERIPVSFFNPNWETLSQLYYLTRRLGKQTQFMPIIFKCIHEENRELSSLEDIKLFLLENGITLEAYNSVSNFQAGLESQLKRGIHLEKLYQIIAAPSLVIGGRYKIDPSMSWGDIQRFFEVADYLVEKSKNGED